MIGARFCIVALVMTACFEPSVGRRERTTVTDDAKVVLARVLTHDYDHEAFDHHYNAAMDAYHRADYAKAIAEWESAYEVDSQPLLVFNIAQAYRKAGHLDEALQRYRKYLELDPSAEHARVTELIERTEHELAKQTPNR
jgi:tetratricopeptide (TPR) repeat protein